MMLRSEAAAAASARVEEDRALCPTLLRASAVVVLMLAQAVGVAAENAADRVFERQFGAAFLAEVWQLYPDWAIAVGYYKYADRLVVPDAAARAAELAQLDRWSRRLQRIDAAALSPSFRADWALLENSFAAERWSLTEYRPWQWNPASYNVADSFALLLSLDYAPLDERLRTFLARLANVPAYYAAAQASIENPTREHTRLAIDQNRGALGVFGADLDERIAASTVTARERELFAERVAAARSAIERYVSWLEALDAELARGTVMPRSFRAGGEIYERRFALQIQSGETAEALYRRALEEKERLLARMALLSDLLWSAYFPNVAPPADRLDRIGRVIARLSEEHVAREGLFAEISRQIPELERWVRDHDLLELDPTRPLQVRETPPYKRGIAIASVDAPGPYDPVAPTYYNVTPLDDLSADRAESLLREYNQWMLPILNIHEAVPGHYVQLVYANKSPSLIKTLFGNGAMIEGWAVYAERMMLESGYGGHTAQSWLIYSKWNLRSVCNVILDYGVHVLDMSEAEALDLLMREAFQSEQEARDKWRRVQLTSVQLASYFAGYSAILELRERLKREQGADFDLKRFHEQFLSYGSAPVRLIRELMEVDAARDASGL
jgi:uncharacterized protein (DUF885 family)